MAANRWLAGAINKQVEELLKRTPWVLVFFRVLLAPIVVLLAWNGRVRIPMAATLVAALVRAQVANDLVVGGE